MGNGFWEIGYDDLTAQQADGRWKRTVQGQALYYYVRALYKQIEDTLYYGFHLITVGGKQFLCTA